MCSAFSRTGFSLSGFVWGGRGLNSNSNSKEDRLKPVLLSYEHSCEDGVYVAQVALQVESIFQSVAIQENFDAGIGYYALAEVCFRLPRGHGVFLHPFVGVFARGA